MASIAEIESYRAKISQSLEEARKAEKGPFPTWNILPLDFYNLKQRGHFQTADAIITRTVGDFMSELGAACKLSRSFRKISIPLFPWAGSKDMWYTIKFGEVPYKDEAHINYLPGSWGREDSLYMYGTPVLVPRDKKDNSTIEAGEAVKYLYLPEARFVSYPGIRTAQITEDEIRNLLTLIVSNPAVHIPVLVEK